MIKSDDLLLVSYLSEESSIAAVARRMHLTPSAISQRLSLLESRLCLTLADRNGRSGIIMTADGEHFASRAKEVLSEFHFLCDEMNDRRGVIGGQINVIAPFGFGHRHVAPLLGQFGCLHPALSVDLKLTDDLNYLPQNAWDILIRVAPRRETSLVSTVLSKNKRLICSSPEYIKQYGRPLHPEDLKHHRCISITEDGSRGVHWNFTSEEGVEKTIKLKPYLTTNDGETALDWAIDGLGIIVRSEWSAAPAINTGQLVELVPGWSAPEAPIIALTTTRYAESVRISTVLNYLAEHIQIESTTS